MQSVRKYETPLGSRAANLIGYLGKADPQQVNRGYSGRSA